MIRSTGPVETYEVGPEGEILWNLEIRGEDVDERFVAYRAWPITSLVGETILLRSTISAR